MGKDQSDYKSMTYEGYGPHGIAVFVDTLTFTAIAICLPSLVNVLAMWPHLFSLAAFLYSNALPIGLYF